jgi:hypothetical protein
METRRADSRVMIEAIWIVLGVLIGAGIAVVHALQRLRKRIARLEEWRKLTARRWLEEPPTSAAGTPDFGTKQVRHP